MTASETCRGCWWHEGGRCYVGDPPRNERGQSLVLAERRCEKYKSTRQVLRSVIPDSVELVILSDRSITPQEPIP